MYKKYCNIPINTIAYLKQLLAEAKWKDVIGSGANYRTWFCDIELHPFGIYRRAFFLLLPPNGTVHRHRDASSSIKTYTIPVFTNAGCMNNAYYEEHTLTKHLRVGWVYETDRTVEHDSINSGETDRIHLLVEV